MLLEALFFTSIALYFRFQLFRLLFLMTSLPHHMTLMQVPRPPPPPPHTHTYINININKRLPFLDILIYKSEVRLETSLQKTDQYWPIYLPISTVILVSNIMLCLAFNIYSSWKRFHKDIKVIKTILQKNEFPVDKVDRNIKNI